ncbi:hypothetical protein NUU61_005204 [Penicillium alfredii]|uniref:F-box domain-containing protein n=1 Tax=Penicillium alfredii TaxID=1506179 RepID=A0A9W9K7D1_9EURO|nr:uncharacterized protein NUU61_005204 [Penicillium alfredii]KAJ5095848.1 hypothetical protein NUU61_005204 [Penicillium alfredii]
MASVASFHEHPSDRRLLEQQQRVDEILHEQPSTHQRPSSLFDQLPPEILHYILSHLSARDLTSVFATCRILAAHGTNDLLWAELVNSHLPFRINDPGPFSSFRRLYFAHQPCWFIPQYKIWFADVEHTGRLILARYDNRRGVIEGYRIIAERGARQFHVWESNPDVIIQSFNPTVRLWLDDPVLMLKDPNPSSPTASCQPLWVERRMPMASESQHVFNSLSLCSPESPQGRALSDDQLWPPPTVISDHRVCRDTGTPNVQPPRDSSQLSELTFRVRRWASFRLALSPNPNEAQLTYATLDPSLYTPTKDKPYQGIWIGDYSAHGCEFLLFCQRDLPLPSASRNPSPGSQDEDENEYTNTKDSHMRRIGLAAVKLTGDPNVPRGELSFIADDIGPNGLIRVSDEEPYRGSPIVRCLGHVAGLGFRDHTFISSQLILISPDYVAHYWEEMGHISYFRRVDIDSLLQT